MIREKAERNPQLNALDRMAEAARNFSYESGERLIQPEDYLALALDAGPRNYPELSDQAAPAGFSVLAAVSLEESNDIKNAKLYKVTDEGVSPSGTDIAQLAHEGRVTFLDSPVVVSSGDVGCYIPHQLDTYVPGLEELIDTAPTATVKKVGLMNTRHKALIGHKDELEWFSGEVYQKLLGAFDDRLKQYEATKSISMEQLKDLDQITRLGQIYGQSDAEKFRLINDVIWFARKAVVSVSIKAREPEAIYSLIKHRPQIEKQDIEEGVAGYLQIILKKRKLPNESNWDFLTRNLRNRITVTQDS